MPRSVLTLNTQTRNGASLVTEVGDVPNGNMVQGGNITLMSFYAPLGPVTVTVYHPSYVDGDNTDGIKVPNRELSVPAATVFLWMLPPNEYTQSDGNVWIDYSGGPISVSALKIEW